MSPFQQSSQQGLIMLELLILRHRESPIRVCSAGLLSLPMSYFPCLSSSPPMCFMIFIENRAISKNYLVDKARIYDMEKKLSMLS